MIERVSRIAPATGGPLPSDVGTSLGEEDRKVAHWCLSALGVLSATSLIGVAFSLYLVTHFPLLLVALSPLGRHMILVAPIVDPVAFVLVVGARRMLFYLVFFYLGRSLGPQAVLWIEARATQFGRFVRWLERLFSRAPCLVTALATGPAVSALAGISGMRVGVFAPLAALGLVLRTLGVLLIADWMREPIEALLSLIDQYWIPGTVVLVTGIALHQWRRHGSSF